MPAHPRTTVRHATPSGLTRIVAVLACLLIPASDTRASAPGHPVLPVETPAPGGEEPGVDSEPTTSVCVRPSASSRHSRPSAVAVEAAPPGPSHPADSHAPQHHEQPTARTSRPHVLRC